MALKRCSICKEFKPLEEFCRDKSRKDGRCYQCKECRKTWYQVPANKKKKAEQRKKYEQIPANRKKKAEHAKKYAQVPAIKKRIAQRKKEYRQIPANKERAKKYYQIPAIKKRRSERAKKRCATDTKYRLNRLMGKGIGRSLKNGDGKHGRSWESLVPYSVIQIEKHLKKTLPEGYTWQDFMQGKLHIDHKVPKSIFQFEKSEDLGFQRCWALDNLQLLRAEENRRKSTKLIKPFQKTFPIEIQLCKKEKGIKK